jgi:hypothetical protein
MTEPTISEKLLYSTIKLHAGSKGVISSTGTGFFFNFAESNDRHVPCIVTNKHVIQGADLLVAKCHLLKDGGPSDEFIECLIDINQNSVVLHPDPDVDLCAITIAGLLNNAIAQQKPLFFTSLSFDIVPPLDDWKYFDAMEDVIMLGCPNGIYDETNNLPIARRGITASLISKKYNGKNEFMVDMACFPGSSGSPVFILNREGYLDRKDNCYKMGGTRLLFVGILYAGPQITGSGDIVLATPPHISFKSMMHLGNVIRSSELSALNNIIKLLP